MDSSMKQELQAVSGLFQRLIDDLSSHLRKEEFVLFPYIKQRISESVPSMPLLNSVLQQMRREHRQYTDTMSQIRKLTNNYTAPDDACIQIRLCLAVLNEFEYDLVEHIYLENNILFPKLLQIEDADNSDVDSTDPLA
jgi:regulator of cell morphogenesis and NO signaling